MDRNEFWELVEASRRESTDCEEQAQALAALLAQRTPEEIIAFDEQLHARRLESFRWDLWAVAYIAQGGCSNDSFDYFRGWLVAQGREYFEAALASPERAVDRAEAGRYLECEAMLYVADDAYRERTGDELPLPTVSQADVITGEPAGEQWDEEDLARLYPELWRRFEQTYR
jgi:hypothetical protein